MTSEEQNREERPEGTNEDESLQGGSPAEEDVTGGPAEAAGTAETAPGEDPGVVPGYPEGPEDAELPIDEAAGAGQELAAIAEELEATRRERDEYLDSMRRIKAEFDNSRKRLEREKVRILETASEALIKDLLPVVDNLDRALESEGDIRNGVRATRDQLVAILGQQGLTPVVSDGQNFDPNVHEAVMGQPSEEHEEGTVIQTFERGYVLNGKSIRPAKVVVAR